MTKKNRAKTDRAVIRAAIEAEISVFCQGGLPRFLDHVNYRGNANFRCLKCSVIQSI